MSKRKNQKPKKKTSCGTGAGGPWSVTATFNLGEDGRYTRISDNAHPGSTMFALSSDEMLPGEDLEQAIARLKAKEVARTIIDQAFEAVRNGWQNNPLYASDRAIATPEKCLACTLDLNARVLNMKVLESLAEKVSTENADIDRVGGKKRYSLEQLQKMMPLGHMCAFVFVRKGEEEYEGVTFVPL